MSYSTGTSTGVNDLLDKLRLFAIAEGWTANRNAAVTGGTEVCLEKGTSFFNLLSGQNTTLRVDGIATASKYGISINGSDGYSGGDNWDRQSGYPQRTVTPSVTDQFVGFLPIVTNFGSFPAYHFFSYNSGDSIHVELEISTGIFLRLGFGKLDLFAASVTGDGRYFYATCGRHVTNSISSNQWLGEPIGNTATMEEVPFRAAEWGLSSGKSGSAVRCQVGATNAWAGSGSNIGNTSLPLAAQGGCCHDRVIMQLSPNPLNGVGVLTPVTVAVNNAGQYLQPIGTMPGIRYMDMTNYLPGDEFTLGSDTWKVFPWYNKGGRSDEFGIAHLKIV